MKKAYPLKSTKKWEAVIHFSKVRGLPCEWPDKKRTYRGGEGILKNGKHMLIVGGIAGQPIKGQRLEKMA